MATSGQSLSTIRASYPDYTIIKNKIQLTPEIDIDKLIQSLEQEYAGESLNKVDGLKINFKEGWVHLRKSNTEPIIRVYAESSSSDAAESLASQVMESADRIINS
jgi:phosphomannomutase